MKYSKLGNTNIDVSILCLGTQTWGAQNSESEAHDQMDMAVEAGINFFDTAEMYPFPLREETYGRTEIIIGEWFKERKCRNKIVIATKIVGRSNMEWLVKGGTRLTPSRIREAAEGSLKRLQTDYIDLYQLHWPDRYTNNFGRLIYNPDPDDRFIPIEDQLGALKELVDEGKVKHIGVSNETPWGLMTFLRLSESKGWPRVVTIQNPYSLLNRTFEVGLSEVAIREKCGLLSYSPLAFGLLTGKYAKADEANNARITKYSDASKRYNGVHNIEAAEEYVKIAGKYDLKPAQMALAFNLSRTFMTSTIIGASNLGQLKDNMNAVNINLPEEIFEDIEATHKRNLFPCP